MKAAIREAAGPPEVLRFGEAPDPEVGPLDVLIQVQAISIEGGDLLSRRLAPPPPAIVGYQAAGVVAEIGSGVTRVKVGERVAGFHWSGSHAELFCVPEAHAYPVPDGLDIGVASTIPVTFGTADDALFDHGRLGAGETVLVQGAAGGVGVAAVQLAKAAGATVIATATGEERLARLRDLGADHGLDYRTADIAAEAMRLTDGRGVDLVLDMAGGAGSKALLGGMALRGRMVLVGFASGERQTFDFADLVGRGLSVSAFLFGKEMGTPRAQTMIARHMQAAAAGRITMPIDRTFRLAQAAAAHAHAETGHPFGRVLITP